MRGFEERCSDTPSSLSLKMHPSVSLEEFDNFSPVLVQVYFMYLWLVKVVNCTRRLSLFRLSTLRLDFSCSGLFMYYLLLVQIVNFWGHRCLLSLMYVCIMFSNNHPGIYSTINLFLQINRLATEQIIMLFQHHLLIWFVYLFVNKPLVSLFVFRCICGVVRPGPNVPLTKGKWCAFWPILSRCSDSRVALSDMPGLRLLHVASTTLLCPWQHLNPPGCKSALGEGNLWPQNQDWWSPIALAGILLGTLLTRITFKDCFGGPGGWNPPRIQRLRRRCSSALWSAKGMAEHNRRHGHPLQPEMFSSCDALPYHWNPTSMAERVGLPPCNGCTTLNTLPYRFSVPPISSVFKSCGDGGVAKRQVMITGSRSHKPARRWPLDLWSLVRLLTLGNRDVRQRPGATEQPL